MIKLIAIDLDGTLLDSDKKIPKENIEAIQKVAATGVKIVLCTGRPQSGIMPYFDELGLSEEEYIIMNNGATTLNTKTGKLVAYDTLTHQEIADLQEACQDYPGVDLTLTGDRSYYVIADQVPDLVAYDASLVFDVAKARNLKQIDQEGERIFLGMFMGQPDLIDKFEKEQGQKLSQSYSVVRSQDYIFEAMPQGVNKALGLKKLADHLGLTADNVMALGDAANDLEMLTYATHSVAMGNASDDIKAISRYVTTTNDDCGVAKAIYDYVLAD